MRFRKILITTIVLIFILFPFINKKAVYPEESPEMQTITFYGIGPKDTYEQLLEKLKNNKFKCSQAKSTYLDTSGIPLKKLYDKVPEKLKKIYEMDSRLKNWGTGTKYKDMNIEVLDCETSVPNVFKGVVVYNSGLTKEMLSIYSRFNEYSMVKETILKKHGLELIKDYWQKNNDMLIMYEKFDSWHLIILYGDNITKHYRIIEDGIKKENIQKQKNLDNVF